MTQYLISQSGYRTSINGVCLDNKTLCLSKIEALTASQIRKAIKDVIAKIKLDIPDLDETFVLNIPLDENKIFRSWGFAHFSDPRIYNVLLGYSIDGKERYEKTEKTIKVESKLTEETSIKEPTKWSDVEEESEEKERKVLPVLYRIPSIQITDEQKKTHRLHSNSYDLSISAAYCNIGVKEGYDPLTLYCNLPEIEGRDMKTLLKDIFSRYSTIPGFPKIKLTIKGTYITFAKIEDAAFAQIMQKKTFIRDVHGQIFELFFRNAIKKTYKVKKESYVSSSDKHF